jgi:hypothetical protein
MIANKEVREPDNAAKTRGCIASLQSKTRITSPAVNKREQMHFKTNH